MIAPRSHHLSDAERATLIVGLGYVARRKPQREDYQSALRAALCAYRRKEESLYRECQRSGRKFCLEATR